MKHSRFVTVVIEHADNVEPLAYQVSDQCVALERDGVLGKAPTDPYMMAAVTPGKGQLMPKIIHQNKALRGGEEFLPDEFIVKVVASNPKEDKGLLFHATFPSPSSSTAGMSAAFKAHYNEFSSQDYKTKLSDFNLLIYLTTIMPAPLVKKLCNAIRDEVDLDNDTKGALDTESIRLGVFA